MIEVRNIRFAYREKLVLRDVSIRFGKNELCGIVGPNGCGKTTLLRLLARLEQAKSGEILFENRLYSAYPRREFAQRVAFMPQTRPAPEMEVQEFVAHGRYPYRDFLQKGTPQDEAIVRRAMQTTGSEQHARSDLRELSGGERQRVYIAQLLAQETPVALMDEPTTYLDIGAQFSVMKMAQQMRDDGKCVVVVLHDLALAMQYCDRIVVMDGGTICADDLPENLADSDIWQRVFGVQCRSVCLEGRQKYLFEA